MAVDDTPQPEKPADDIPQPAPEAEETLKLPLAVPDGEHSVDEPQAATTNTTVTGEPPADDIAAQETAKLASVTDNVPAPPPPDDETTLKLPVVDEATLRLPAAEAATPTAAPVSPPTMPEEPTTLPEFAAPVPTIDEPAPRLLLPTVVEPLPPLAPEKPRPRRGLRIVAVTVMLLLLPIVGAGTWLQLRSSQSIRASATPTAQPTAAITGPFQWQSDTLKTPPNPQFAVFATQKNPVDPAFQQYYAKHNGATLLGNALTPGYTTNGGWIQVFTNGALLKPSTTPATPAQATPTPGDLSAQIIGEGSADPATGIVRVPLLHLLLTVGSALPIGGANSGLSYVDVRQATAANKQVSVPVWRAERGDTSANAVFIAERQQNGQAFGHDIPLSIWSYINRADISPDGWEATFGQPITEALATTVVRGGTVHHLLVQAFWLGAVELDADALDVNGQPAAQLVTTGADYLQTLGPPPVAITEGAQAWATGNLTVVSAPGSNNASVHLGVNFPVTLTGQTSWLNGALWYNVSWKSVSRSGTGWAPGSAVTRTAPGADALPWASFDALSPDLAHYLAGFGNNVGSVIYDVTRGQYYAYNPNTQFTLASSSKVSIMMAYLDMVESQGRGLNDQESYEISIMIQHSDNNAAQLLYDRLGDGAGMTAWMQRVGIQGYRAHPAGWGWGMLPPTGQVQLLTMLQKGQILNASDRAFALRLMRSVESDQRNGVGDTLPKGASVAMKDGWVTAPDGLWAVNTSGIVTAGSETYIIVVYSQHQLSENAGWTIARYVCGHAGKLLVS
jgi:beta-lactamase class A